MVINQSFTYSKYMYNNNRIIYTAKIWCINYTNYISLPTVYISTTYVQALSYKHTE